MAAQSLGSVKVFVHVPKHSFEAIAGFVASPKERSRVLDGRCLGGWQAPEGVGALPVSQRWVRTIGR